MTIAATFAAKADRGAGPGGPPDGEENTFGLPEGDDLAEELKRWYESQREEVLGTVATIGLPVPGAVPALAAYDDRMAEAFTPMLASYWDAAGKTTLARLGLDPDAWKVTSPHLREKIEQAAYAFCASTNASTSKRIDHALTDLHRAFAQGQVTEGETLPQLTGRVNAIFDGLSEGKARRIAATEASRAVHAAQIEADRQSGVVAGTELLLSADACELCRSVFSQVRRVPLGRDFAVIGDHPVYSRVASPPIHVACQCTSIDILLPEYGGPENPQWGETLIQPQKAGPDGEKPERAHAPAERHAGEPPERQPAPRAAPEPHPFAAKLAAYTKGDEKVAELQRIGELQRVKEDRVKRLGGLLEEATAAAIKYIEADPDSPESAAARREVADLQLSLSDAIKAAARAKAAARSAAMAVLRVDRPADVDAKPGQLAPFTKASQTGFGEATAFLRETVSAPGEIRVGVKSLRRNARAFSAGPDVYLPVNVDATTVVHEIGHFLEESVPSWGRAARDFLDHRVGDETPTWMGGNYAAHEVGRSDDFGKAFGNLAAYVGKVYSHTTEVTSMGFEKLLDDPTGFAHADPEYAKFLIGVMHGDLR